MQLCNAFAVTTGLIPTSFWPVVYRGSLMSTSIWVKRFLWHNKKYNELSDYNKVKEFKLFSKQRNKYLISRGSTERKISFYS